MGKRWKKPKIPSFLQLCSHYNGHQIQVSRLLGLQNGDSMSIFFASHDSALVVSLNIFARLQPHKLWCTMIILTKHDASHDSMVHIIACPRTAKVTKD